MMVYSQHQRNFMCFRESLRFLNAELRDPLIPELNHRSTTQNKNHHNTLFYLGF